MSEKDPSQSETDQSDYMKRGKGRKDEVGRSGIYPASSQDAPGDAEIRTEGELGSRSGTRKKKGRSRRVT